MDSVAQSFLSEIERFLSSAGVEPTALGKQALGDPNFVFDLRKGRSPSTRTIDKVRGWIAAAGGPRRTPPQPWSAQAAAPSPISSGSRPSRSTSSARSRPSAKSR